MNVTCPQCRTVYRLPDEKAKAGVKLRCSVCRHVFELLSKHGVANPCLPKHLTRSPFPLAANRKSPCRNPALP